MRLKSKLRNDLLIRGYRHSNLLDAYWILNKVPL